MTRSYVSTSNWPLEFKFIGGHTRWCYDHTLLCFLAFDRLFVSLSELLYKLFVKGAWNLVCRFHLCVLTVLLINVSKNNFHRQKLLLCVFVLNKSELFIISRRSTFFAKTTLYHAKFEQKSLIVCEMTNIFGTLIKLRVFVFVFSLCIWIIK